MKKINMATKLTLLFVLIATLLHTAFLPNLQRDESYYQIEVAENNKSSFYNELNSYAYEKAFQLYYELKLKTDDTLTLTSLYLKDSKNLSSENQDYFTASFKENLANANRMNLDNYLLYSVTDTELDQSITNTSGNLLNDSTDMATTLSVYPWYMIINFDDTGTPTVSYQSDDNYIVPKQMYYSAFNYIFSFSTILQNSTNNTFFVIDENSYEYQPIKNVTFKYAIKDLTPLESFYSYNTYSSYSSDSPMMYLFITISFALSFATLLLILLRKHEKMYGFENKDENKPELLLIVNDKTYGATLRSIPVEILLFLDLIILGVSTGLGYLANAIIPAFFIFFLLYLFVAYNVWYFILLIREKRLKQQSICGWLWRYMRKPAHQVYDFALHLDMTNQDTQRLVVLVSINLAIVIFISLFNSFEIKLCLLLLYSVGLYFLLKKYIGSVNRDYHKLLNVIRKIAVGKTNEHIDENLGLFEPFKPELKDIQTNIETAIAEEVHSQQMKTELITNVSHDLKTPLTSLISYVDLLKKENVSQKDREKYLDILDKSSLRLKHLVEDLFEVSKANSGNVSLDLMKMDIISLIKQVEVECADVLKKQKLSIRNTFSDEKIILSLDSQKTYRIFENLISNISKYALKGTRVYIDVKDYDTFVEVSMKNISAQELNFDAEDLTERFMRGDKSRNTEGSGLGLAIVKSFTELQRGTLKIQMDGDLFKVFIRFPKTKDSNSEIKD